MLINLLRNIHTLSRHAINCITIDKILNKETQQRRFKDFLSAGVVVIFYTRKYMHNNVIDSKLYICKNKWKSLKAICKQQL